MGAGCLGEARESPDVHSDHHVPCHYMQQLTLHGVRHTQIDAIPSAFEILLPVLAGKNEVGLVPYGVSYAVTVLVVDRTHRFRERRRGSRGAGREIEDLEEHPGR